MLTAEQIANLTASQRQETRRQVVYRYGNFLASLIPIGGWWATITIRDRSQTFKTRRNSKRTLRGKIRRHYRDCHIRYGHQDAKIEAWRPASKVNRLWNPFTHKILAEVRLFMEFLEASVGAPTGYIIAEEIGELNGRWHLHLLISGVPADIRRKNWRSASFQIRGRMQIEPYDPRRAAAFYAAKYAAKQLGAIHLCGTLRGALMDACETPRGVAVGGQDVVCSDSMPSDFFHSPVGSFRNPQCTQTLVRRVWRQSKRQTWIHFENG